MEEFDLISELAKNRTSTHKNTPASRKRIAFTMAEVLIVLGIIGSVAAMTLPGLVKNHQKKVLVEQLKVAVTTLEQGFKKAMAEDGVESLVDTKLFEACQNAPDWKTDAFVNRCVPVAQKYFYRIKGESVNAMVALGDNIGENIADTNKCKKLVGKTNKWWKLNDKTQCFGWKNQSWTFPNGMRMDWYLKDYGWHAGGIHSIDVNGSKGPNTWGRDVFRFVILPNGHIVPFDSVEYHRAYYTFINNTTANPATISQYYIEKTCTTDKSKVLSSQDGLACAARIIQNGWVMDY
jgi:type II secretory pathway pseudopilin PulG